MSPLTALVPGQSSAAACKDATADANEKDQGFQPQYTMMKNASTNGYDWILGSKFLRYGQLNGNAIVAPVVAAVACQAMAALRSAPLSPDEVIE